MMFLSLQFLLASTTSWNSSSLQVVWEFVLLQSLFKNALSNRCPWLVSESGAVTVRQVWDQRTEYCQSSTRPIYRVQTIVPSVRRVRSIRKASIASRNECRHVVGRTPYSMFRFRLSGWGWVGKLRNWIGSHLWKGVLSNGVVLYAIMSRWPNKTVFIKTNESMC